jgi:TRAP-type C4-dicarboxylate transport system permease small subunit
MTPSSPDDGAQPLIHVDETPTVPPIEHHLEDWLAVICFWSMAVIVFLQFFTRYVLNNSLAWTEEIARYLLMWVTFIGSAVAMRRGTHIAVEVAHMFLPAPAVRVLNFLIDVTVLCFLALLCWFGIAITERMHIQTMTVIEWPMSIVYGGITFGCFLMLWRGGQRFLQAARRGWRPDPARNLLVVD